MMIGRVLGNRYEIVEKIGGGGMALVYKAKCRLLNRFVAIKILRSEYTNDEEFIRKFKRESQAAASLSHPNIVNVYDVGVEDDINYIVMEYVKGMTLKELIVEKGKLKVEEAIDIAIQIAEALNHAHINHIVHRDIKPHNILITDDGRAKVTDFGIARAATSATVTSTSSVIGSVHYFSPEQARGGYTDEKSDIYSLGIVMYEMVTGKLPFQGDSPISVALKHVQENISSPKIIDESIPRNLEKIIMKCVKKDQSLRYNNAKELLRDLNRCKYIDDDFVEDGDIHDSPTIIIPAVKDEVVMSGENSRTSNKRSKKDKKKNKRIITIAAIFSAIFLTSVLAGAYIYIQINDYLTVREVVVPDVRGMHMDEARAIIESNGLKFEIKRMEYNSDYKADYIIQQTVPPGVKRKENYPIEVIVSKGEKLVTVPNLVDKLYSDAEIELEKVNLEVGNVIRVKSELPRDIVISQNPRALTEVAEGTEINLEVSDGPDLNTVLMPNLVGSNIESAKREIVLLGLVVGEPNYQPSNDYPVDTVISQSIPAGTEVEENALVSLIVSSGSDPTKSDNDGENQDSSNESGSNDQNKSIEKKVSISVPLPSTKDKVEVKVKEVDGLQSSIIYEKIHNTDEGKIWITVSGTGKKIFKIYFDGVEYFEREINFEEDN